MSVTKIPKENLGALWVNPDQVVRISVACKWDHSTTKYREVQHKFLFFTWSEKIEVGKNECFKWVNTVEYSHRQYDSWSFDTEAEAVEHGNTLVELIHTVQ